MLLALLGCFQEGPQEGVPFDSGAIDDPVVTDDSGDPATPTDDTGTKAAEPETWTFLVFMNGDNNLESYVRHDLNELEIAGSSENVNVIVEADRAEGYDESDGDWTGGRRYLIGKDGNQQVVSSEVLEDMGEIDMGDPAVLTDFLLWANEAYPAEHVVLILWDHGDGWTFAPPPLTPMGAISYDEESGNDISIAEGELAGALEPFVKIHGPLDLVGFDACNMATFEVAHAMAPWAKTLVGSQSTVGWEGLQYADALNYLKATPDADARGLSNVMAETEVSNGNEEDASAIDLAHMGTLASAIDALAVAALADPARLDHIMTARAAARAAEVNYHDWYVDLGDFADVVATSKDPVLVKAGGDVRAMLSPAVVGAYGNEDYAFLSGLSIHLSTSQHSSLDLYSTGAGATWAQDTHWDELLLAIKAVEDAAPTK